METNFNFKSQVCTDRNQSERLLALGLKKETADMVYTNASLPYHKDVFRVICKEYSQLNKEVNYEISPFSFIPAWSLHRLIEMMPTHIAARGEKYIRDIKPISISYVPTTYEPHFWLYKEITNNYYDGAISTIEWLIKEGYFPKEYLV